MGEQTAEQVDRRNLIRLNYLRIQVEAFIKSDLDHYQPDRSNTERKAVPERLGSVDPADLNAISQLEFNLQVALGVLNWRIWWSRRAMRRRPVALLSTQSSARQPC